MKQLLMVAALVFSGVAAAAYEKDNGIIRVRLYDYNTPMITGMWILGRVAVPHDNIGADFQMATRSSQGDAYNPTQGGDCAGIPSPLTGVIPDWNGALIGTPAAYGILLGLDPRLYNEPPVLGCQGPGGLAPYDMNFGVTLGDGVALAREGMVLDMSVRREASAPNLVKALSELPVAFLDIHWLRYAYYSDDANTLDGTIFLRMNANTAGGPSHDTLQWPLLTNFDREGRAIALCDRPDAVENPHLGTCMGFYAHERTRVYASHRQGATQELVLMSILGDNPGAPVIDDLNWHTSRRLVAVGGLTAVSAVIAQAEQNFPVANWARW
ncbi:hypothetical protein DFR29_11474 [Tahibacter aquaticus]|uniref:Uncharacterized protein n=1 Tax=Tahibacter aquaticus TaxID=520092 RepID=A0A4R6YQM2_9GAMM|nr:hypothetical protein [Tahibacter aquaticus]TDR40022.1 hypothetical protein DFR29_11474 [Tahibacter aquaticus]